MATLLTAIMEITHSSTSGDAALITAILSGGGVVGGYIKMITDKATMKQEIQTLKEKMIEISSSKKALKIDLKEEMEKKDQVLHQRIDRVRDDNIKSYEKLESKIEQLDQKYEVYTQKILDALGKK